MPEENNITLGEEEFCPEAKEYLDWYGKEASPRIYKFAVHLVDCQKCQEKVLSLKDPTAFEMLKISDAEFIRRTKELLEKRQ